MYVPKTDRELLKNMTRDQVIRLYEALGQSKKKSRGAMIRFILGVLEDESPISESWHHKFDKAKADVLKKIKKRFQKSRYNAPITSVQKENRYVEVYYDMECVESDLFDAMILEREASGQESILEYSSSSSLFQIKKWLKKTCPQYNMPYPDQFDYPRYWPYRTLP